MNVDTKWFDRKFDFNFGMEQYPELYRRLEVAPATYATLVGEQSADRLAWQPAGKWSVAENIGHLVLLEPLWQQRFQEIRDNMPAMSPADLNNTATGEAGFNQVPAATLLERFAAVRKETMAFLDSLEVPHFTYALLHPRLQQPMRIIDLMYFVAAHDEHHLHTIQMIFKNH